MRDLHVGVLGQVGFDLPPVALIVAHLVAPWTDWQQPAQGLDVLQRLSKIDDQRLAGLLGLRTRGDVDYRPNHGRRSPYINVCAIHLEHESMPFLVYGAEGVMRKIAVLPAFSHLLADGPEVRPH